MAERPTPHSVAVCTLIALHSDPSSLIHKSKKPQETINDLDSSINSNSNNSSSLGDIEEHLSKVIKYLVTHGETFSLTNLLNLISGPEPIAGPTTHERQFHQASTFLLEDLNQSCISIDSLVDLFAALRATVAQGIIDGDSAHGVYVRKHCLGFDELAFESVGRFWESFCWYVDDAADWVHECKMEMNMNTDVDMDMNMDMNMNERGTARESSIASINDNDTLDDVLSESETNANDSEMDITTDDMNMNMTLRKDNNDIEDSYPSDENGEGKMFPSSSSRKKSWVKKRTKPEEKYTYRQHYHTTQWPLAPRQISRQLMQTCLNLHKEIGIISYVDMEAYIQDILRENPELTLAHYLRFLNDAMHGERIGALESLHRYFDYAMIQERKYRLIKSSLPIETNSNNNNANNNNANNPNNGGNNSSASTNNSSTGNVVQYAAILLASLFHSFANDELAHVATEEAIRVAQQSGDGTCLAFALGWLHASGIERNSHSYSSSVWNDIIRTVSSRAAQYNLRSLVAGASLLRANHLTMGANLNNQNEISSGIIGQSCGFVPANSWSSISAASTEGAMNFMNTVGNSAHLHDIPTHITNLSESGEAMGIFAQQHMAGAALWQSMGYAPLAAASCQTAMQCYRAYLSSDQFDHVAKEIASSALYGTCFSKCYFNQVSSDTQSLCSSLQKLRLSGKSKNILSSSTETELQPKSAYVCALEKMRDLRSDSTKVSGINWCHNVALLLHESSLRKCNIPNASSLNVLLHSCAPLASRDCIKSSVEVLGQSCFLLCRQRKWDLAKKIILQKIIPICKLNRFHYYHALYLLQLVVIHFDSSPNDPARSLTPLLQCISLCEQYSLDVIHAVSLSLLARTHLELGDWRRAKSVLKAAMPSIMQNSHICFQGDSLLCLAKCTLSEVKDLDRSTANADNGRNMACERRKHKILKVAVAQLQQCKIAFEKIIDVIRLREVYYLQAQCYNSLPGCKSKRNEAASSFREMNRTIVLGTLPSWYDAIQSITERV